LRYGGNYTKTGTVSHAVSAASWLHIPPPAPPGFIEETATVELINTLHFRYNSVAQEIVCDTDTISGLAGILDRLGAKTAMILCGPSILRGADVIQRVQEAQS
jgi:hypothetical protein